MNTTIYEYLNSEGVAVYPNAYYNRLKYDRKLKAYLLKNPFDGKTYKLLKVNKMGLTFDFKEIIKVIYTLTEVK